MSEKHLLMEEYGRYFHIFPSYLLLGLRVFFNFLVAVEVDVLFGQVMRYFEVSLNIAKKMLLKWAMKNKSGCLGYIGDYTTQLYKDYIGL